MREDPDLVWMRSQVDDAFAHRQFTRAMGRVSLVGAAAAAGVVLIFLVSFTVLASR